MKGDKLDAANQIVPEVADELAKNPILNDKVRLALVDFSDDAQVLLPLCDLSQQSVIPTLAIRGRTTCYGAAFRLLRTQLERDVTQLRADGFRVFRPAVFFLSDGRPMDAWQDDFAALTSYDKASKTGFRWYPVVIPFGVAAADREVMRSLVHPLDKSKLYMMSAGGDGAAAIRTMTEILISSILSSGHSISGGGGLVLPDATQVPPGIDVEDDWLS